MQDVIVQLCHCFRTALKLKSIYLLNFWFLLHYLAVCYSYLTFQ